MQGFSKTDIDAYVQDQAMYASARSQVCVCVCVCVCVRRRCVDENALHHILLSFASTAGSTCIFGL